MKLRAVLSLQPTDRLHRIAAATDLPIHTGANKTAQIDVLCRHLSNPSLVLKRLDMLRKQHREYVVGLAAEGGELLKEDAIHELGAGFTHRFQTMQDTVSELGLVFEDAETLGTGDCLVGIPEPILKAIPLPARDQGRLRRLMQSRSIGLLRAFASEVGCPNDDSKRAFVARAIRVRLLDPEHLKAYIADLPEAKQAILNLALANDAITQHDVLSAMGEDGIRALDEMVWKTPLFFHSTDRLQTDTHLHLASDLKPAIRALGDRIEDTFEETVVSSGPDPSLTREQTTFLVPNLCTLLGFVEQRRPRVLKHGGVSRARLRDVSKYYRGHIDPGYSEFLLLFAETAGLIKRDTGTWRLAGDAADRLSSVSDVRNALFASWRETDRWNEWTTERPGTRARNRSDTLKSLRRDLLDCLARCPEDSWISYPRFHALLTRRSESFARLDGRPPAARDPVGGDGDELLRRILVSALTWMGLVVLGNPDAFGEPLAPDHRGVFKLTEPGAALIDGREPVSSNSAGERGSYSNGRFILQPNLEILSPPDLTVALYMDLFSIAELKEVDVLARFRVSPQTVHQAMSRGWDGASLRAFLRNHSATGLPEMVEALIQECESKHGEIEISPASGYLVSERPELLDELLVQKKVASHLGVRLSPTTAALNPSTRIDQLVDALNRGGYMPNVASRMTDDEQHNITLKRSELLQLAGFLDTAIQSFASRSVPLPEDLNRLLKRLRGSIRSIPDSEGHGDLNDYSRSFETLFRGGSSRDDIRALSQYQGANPAAGEGDISRLIEYAIDHRLCLEVNYIAERSAKSKSRSIEPILVDHGVLYGFCRQRKGERPFRLDRIQSARLTLSISE